MKKILFCFSVLLCLLLAAGCRKYSEVQYTLNYGAGENGSINGAKWQIVDYGGDGSPVSAIPAAGYHFERWSDGLDTAKRIDYNVTADLAVTAQFAINKYTLTYEAGENGSIEGVSPQTIEHGSDGSLVTAVPDKLYHFIGWSDGVAAASRTDFNVTADHTVTAVFSPSDQYTLNYSAGENGSIEGSASQMIYHGGDGSPVTAVPAAGYRFESWSDGVNNARRSDSDVTADLAVTANFTSSKYTLIYKAGKNGIIDGVSPQTVDHGSDGSTVTAIPSEHYHFAGWSDGMSTPSRVESNVKADLTVTAGFAIDQYKLNYTAGENGSIEGSTPQMIDHGTDGSPVKAVPAAAYHFESWSDGVDTPRRTDTDIVADLAVVANFAINKYILNYEVGENGTIDGINPQTVEHGSDGSPVTAVAQRGYHFATWSDGVTTAERIDSKLSSDLTVSAVFEVNTYSVGGTVSGLVEGTQLILQNNEGDDLIITANDDFKFTTELLNKSTYDVNVLSQPTSPNQTCTVTGGIGTVSYENVTDISVTCILNTYSIGGRVFGLPENDHVVLLNNEADKFNIEANGFFTFATPLDDGSQYEVTIDTQPKRPNWTCELENAAGVLAGMDVTDVIVDCFPEVVLQAKAGIRKIKLNWNSYDFPDEVTFNLCLAQDDFSRAGFSNCQELKEGALETKIDSPPLTVVKLINDRPYWFQMEASYESGRKTLSEVIKAMPFGGLNDSGIDWCSDDENNLNSDGTRPEKTASCDAIALSFPNQDAFHGRDALARARDLPKAGIGSAGFDFTKLCQSGEAAGEGKCPPNPQPGMGVNNWACTRDNVTGLIWEIKTEDGLRTNSNTYSWYNPDETLNGGDPGLKNGGSCKGSECDTQAYIKAINDLGLCGAEDWRLPTKRELLSIVDNGRFKPASDTRFFPNTLSAHYWSSTPYSEQEESAWQVYFLYGEASLNIKSENNHIRLIRGRTVTFGLENP